MNELKFDTVDKALLRAIPELQEHYGQGLAWWKWDDHPGQYIICGFVLEPFLKELLGSNRDPAILKRIFDFFEDMARSSDIQVVNLLQVEIFEDLVGEPDRLALAWKYMGEETKNLARRTARIRRCEHNLPA